MDLPPGRRGFSRDTVVLLAQLGLATAGGWLFDTLGVPAGWLSGSLIAVALMVAFGRSQPMPPRLIDIALLLTGISLGASASPEALAALGRYPASLVILMVAIVVVTLASAEYLRRRPHWTREEALLASVPGALTVVLAVAADRRARLGPLVVIQMFRLLALMLILPSVIAMVETATGAPVPSAQQASVMSYPALAALIMLGGVIGYGLKRVNVPAPLLFGAMIASVGAHSSGLVAGGLPEPIFIATLVLMGTFVAVRMRTLNRLQVRAAMPEALVAFSISVAVAAMFAGLVTVLVGVRFDVAFLAFAPGGLEAMIVLSIALGLDPLYVGSHHLARMLAISVALPILMRLRDPKDPDGL